MNSKANIKSFYWIMNENLVKYLKGSITIEWLQYWFFRIYLYIRYNKYLIPCLSFLFLPFSVYKRDGARPVIANYLCNGVWYFQDYLSHIYYLLFTAIHTNCFSGNALLLSLLWISIVKGTSGLIKAFTKPGVHQKKSIPYF